MRYARIVNNAVAELREFGIAPDPNPKKGLDWRPCARAERPAHDPEIETISGPSYTVGASEVTEQYTKRDLTAGELDARKELRITAYDRLSFDVNFDQENRIRALENKAPVTRAQYRSALKARL